MWIGGDMSILCMCGGQKTACRNEFSPPFMWVLGMKPRFIRFCIKHLFQHSQFTFFNSPLSMGIKILCFIIKMLH